MNDEAPRETGSGDVSSGVPPETGRPPGSDRQPMPSDRLAFLVDAGRVLSSSLDYEPTLHSVCRLSVPTMADYCVIDIVGEDGTIRRVATAHRDPEKEALAAELRQFPPIATRATGVPEVLRTGEPALFGEVTDAVLTATTRDDQHLRIVGELGVRSFVVVPLVARGHTLGAITLAYTDSGRRYGPEDVALAEQLAGHAALALENARLYREAQSEITERHRARDELDREHAFLQLLLDVTTAANEAPTLQEALGMALERVRAHTGWPVGHAYLLRESGELQSTGLWSTDDPERFRALREATEAVSFVAGIGLAGRVLATGQPVAIVDVTEDPSFLRSQLAADLAVKAAFAFPVVAGSEVAGVLEFFSGRPVDPEPFFLEVMSHVGTQLGRVVERERASAALRVSEERAREIAEHIREVFWVSDPELTRLHYVSPAYEEVWGRSRDGLYEDPLAWMRAIVPEDRERVAAAAPRRPRGEYEEEYRIARPNGEVRWILDRAFPVTDDAGQVVRIVGIAEDITEQKAAEDERLRLLALERQARAEAEDALQARDELMRMVSHDLRNPLNTIGMAAALLDELSPDEHPHQLDVLRRTTDHMQRLVNGLLDFHRVEAGHGIPVELKPVEAGRLLADGCSLFAMQASANGVEIVRDAPEQLPPILADEDRALQVLWNLTGNAIKFTPAGGTVRVSVRPREQEVVFSVSDEGPGIAEEDQERLFDPFWQAKRTARMGTGLGLPISKAIVEAHGGSIWIESEPDRGASFFFTLRIAETS